LVHRKPQTFQKKEKKEIKLGAAVPSLEINETATPRPNLSQWSQ